MTLVNLAQLLHMFPLFHMPQRTRSLFHDKHRSDVAEIKKYQHMIVFPIFPNIFSRFSQYLPNLFPNLFPNVFPRGKHLFRRISEVHRVVPPDKMLNGQLSWQAVPSSSAEVCQRPMTLAKPKLVDWLL